jgi:hypothetical protein
MIQPPKFPKSIHAGEIFIFPVMLVCDVFVYGRLCQDPLDSFSNMADRAIFRAVVRNKNIPGIHHKTPALFVNR